MSLKHTCKQNELIILKNPEQNGVAEHMNQTLVECANLPHKFWGEPLLTAAYLQNRSPIKAVYEMTPYEAREKLQVEHLRIFWCHVPKDEGKKLDSKSRKCNMGYGTYTKGH